MNELSEKTQEPKSQSLNTRSAQLPGSGQASVQVVNNRDEASAQRKLQDLADKSQGVSQLKELEQLANKDPQAEVQTSTDQTEFTTDLEAPEQSTPTNNTGLPDQLKTGVESLSGISMDDVSVHTNSDKPAQLQAHAYAQGTDIHLGAGQEKHLPHEAWHVVQQKQGRVKPTMQMMEQSENPSPAATNAINVNDDAGLEQEADLMGKKALNLALQKKSIFSGAPTISGNTAQLAKDESPANPNSFQSVEKFDPSSLAAEESVNPESRSNKAALADIKTSGIALGEEAQIKLEGELTGGAKLNRFLGNESTYSKLLRKAEEFNKSKEVTEKQSLLKELKPLARTWLERHAKTESPDGKQDENEKLKRESVYKFLNQTTSNYPEIIKNCKDLQLRMKTFVADPINNRNLFYKSVMDYQHLETLVNSYKSSYPPSVNLLFVTELESINLAKNDLIKKGSQKGPTFDTQLGFSITEPEVSFDLGSGIYQFSGNLELAISGVTNTSGKVTVEFNSDESFKNITVEGKTCSFMMGGVDFELSNFTYDYSNKEFITENASGSLDILGTKITLNAIGVSIKDGITDFQSLEGQISGSIDTKSGIAVIDPTIKIVKGESIVMNGGLNLSIPNLVNASGSVEVLMDSQKNIQNITVTNGSSEASLNGFLLQLNGISYDYSASQFSILEARGEITIFENLVALTVTGLSIQKNTFDYEKIEGELPDVDYGFFSLQKTVISYSKELKAFEGKTSYQFNTAESPIGFQEFKTSGELKVHWNPEGDKYYSIDNGALEFKLFGQKAEAKNFNYSSQEKSISAEELNLEVDLLEFKKTFAGQNISISSGGIDFKELTTEASGAEFDLVVFSLKPKTYKIIKDKSGSLKVVADGSMTFGLPDYLGIPNLGQIEGNVGIGFDKSPPEYHITSGSAEVKMSNPLNKISEILGDNWSQSRYELSAAIPVFPAVSAIFGIYIQYGAQFANDIAATISLDSSQNAIILQASTGMKASVEGGVFGGIQGGSQLLVALALLLRAAGTFDMNTEIGYTKNFPLGQKPADNSIKDDSGFKYRIYGDAKVGAYLDIVATALYFFRKQFSLELGQKSLGEFEFSNSKKSDPDMGETALVDRKQLDEAIDPSLKEEAKGLSIEQLLDLDSSHRFSAEEKKEAIDVIKSAEAGRETINQAENNDPSQSKKFNNVALANLQFYNQFIDKRCNWAEIYKVLDTLGDSLKPESDLRAQSDKGEKYLKEKLLTNIETLGNSSNIAQAFVTHYNEKVRIFAESYPDSIISPYHSLLLKKGELLQTIENLKKGYLHSSFWGDKSKQVENIKTGSWFGVSNYSRFATAYGQFRTVMLANKNILEEVDALGKETAFKLVQDHQRQIENPMK